MTTHTVVNYSDIYPGPKPELATLLAGINSKIIVLLMAVVNAEVDGPGDAETVQARITAIIVQNFQPVERQRIAAAIHSLRQKTGEGPVVLWGRRYVLAFMKYEFLHYQQGEAISTTPEQELRIFKGYLLIVEKENTEDRQELALISKATAATDPFKIEKITWPFILKQFETNQRANPASQLYMVLALVADAVNHPELRQAWKNLVERNGFPTLRIFLGSYYRLLTITQNRFPDGPYKVFSWITPEDIPPHLLNLSFDPAEFQADPKKQINYLGLKEKPLFNCGDNRFAILDRNYLINRAYMGTVFELYYKGGLEGKPPFRTFPDFKSYLAKNVSEKIVFQSLFSWLFAGRKATLAFDDGSVDGHPDCMITTKDSILLIEFKDYIFPGVIVEKYEFDLIKAHLDEKFIQTRDGKKKGISQIVSQIEWLPTTNAVQKHSKKGKKLKVYPVIVHTSFLYQMPGINSYLQRAFQQQLAGVQVDGRLDIKDLTLIDLETFFEMLPFKKIGALRLVEFLERYHRLLANRQKRLSTLLTQETLLASKASFDEVFHTIYLREEAKVTSDEHGRRLTDSLGLSDVVLDSF